MTPYERAWLELQALAAQLGIPKSGVLYNIPKPPLPDYQLERELAKKDRDGIE